MNRSDYENYLKTLSKEQILDIRDLAEMEYFKRVVWEAASKFLRKKFKDKEYIEFQERKLKPGVIAKHFYIELDKAFMEDKYYYLKVLKDGNGCVKAKVNKLFKATLTLAMIESRIDIMLKENNIKFARGISSKNFSRVIEYKRSDLIK